MTAPRPAGRLDHVPAEATGQSPGGRTAAPFTTRTPRIVAARRLHRRRDRDATRRFLAEGPQAVREALAAPGVVRELFTTAAGLHRYADLVDAAAATGATVSTVDDDALTALTETVTPQGVVAVCDHVDVTLDAALGRRPTLVAALAEIRDPGNAGTVLRTADAAGAGAVIFAGAAVDPYNGKCVRASAGSLFHLDVVRHDDPAHAVDALRAAGLRVLATTGHGDTDLDDLADSGALAAPTAWLFGTEAHGLPVELVDRADARVRVPLYGRAESLNLAAAAAVCLYTSARAQRPGRPPR
ncbi:RNA methyltransferase [Solwaraspora sp. WMMA2056]|uniref:TrmH family RNA methyltransferase n=1 Tax=Solwaraspora sp. WMMA2056 TaxID=3015161 RepID=UPI00259B6154|nr:RNA methyltransferase [Solwaraspora sp. WMMA2056]WJK39209.1 RNA methyltransferase [Solwaraspora sp. WMMA2056]